MNLERWKSDTLQDTILRLAENLNIEEAPYFPAPEYGASSLFAVKAIGHVLSVRWGMAGFFNRTPLYLPCSRWFSGQVAPCCHGLGEQQPGSYHGPPAPGRARGPSDRTRHAADGAAAA